MIGLPGCLIISQYGWNHYDSPTITRELKKNEKGASLGRVHNKNCQIWQDDLYSNIYLTLYIQTRVINVDWYIDYQPANQLASQPASLPAHLYACLPTY